MSATNEHLTHLFTIQDPTGHVIVTMVSLSEPEAIREFMETEQGINIIANAGRWSRGEKTGPAPSWEYYEAEGFKVIPISIVLR